MDSLVLAISDYIGKNFGESWFRAVGRGKVLEAICNKLIADYYKLY
jgi:hypothetical protein